MAFSIAEMDAQVAEAVPAREVMSTYTRTYTVSLLNGSDLFNGNQTALLSGNETNPLTGISSVLGLEPGEGQ